LNCTLRCIFTVYFLSGIMNVREFGTFKVCMGIKEDRSSTGRDCAAEFHHVTARCLLARVLKPINLLFI
jgi:hypothetical protein